MSSGYDIFLKVAELGSVTRAAAALGYTQTGASHAIAKLERQAGFPLFIRSASGMALTPAGEALLAPMRELVNAQRSLEQAMGAIRGTVEGTLRLGSFTSVSTKWLPRIVGEFQRRHPGVEFEIWTGDYDEITTRLEEGRIDCGFLSLPVSPTLEFRHLYDDPMLAVLAPSHPLAAKGSVTLDEIRAEPIIMPMRGSDNDIRNVLDLEHHEVTIRYVLNDDLSTLAMVNGGFGVSVMPRLIVESCGIDLTTRPLRPARHRDIGIATTRGRRPTALTQAFIDFLCGTDGTPGQSAGTPEVP